MPAVSDLVDLAHVLAPTPQGRLLGSARHALLVTAAGTGVAVADGRALTRWRGDRLADLDGLFVYLRDLDAGTLWSAGYAPTRATPEAYAVRWLDGAVEIERTDDGIATRMCIAVAPGATTDGAPAELRRVTVENRSSRTRHLDVTAYCEPVLQSRAADLSHPAFSKLFVQTERAEGRSVLLARRRPRGADERPFYAVMALTGDGDATHETDRMRFIGRGRSVARPAALDAGTALSGTTGNVLDPVFALRRPLSLAPGEWGEVTVVLAGAASRDAALAVADRFCDADAVAAGFAEAHDAARDEAASWTEADHDARACVAGVLYGAPALLDSAGEATTERAADLCRALGLDVLPLPAGAGHAETPDLPPPHAFPAPPAAPLGAAETGPLQQDNGTGGFSGDGTEYVIRITPDGDAGWILPPLPWANVIANEDGGFVITERGASTTWAANSREHRLTPWTNDPVSDLHGDALYLRDAAGAVWSAHAGPCPARTPYTVRHGWGTTTVEHCVDGLAVELTEFVPRHGAARVSRLRLSNTGAAPRRVEATRYAHLVLGSLPAGSDRHVVTEWTGEAGGALLARNPESGAFAERVAVATTIGGERTGWTADRDAFIGRHRDASCPAALATDEPLDGRAGAGLDPCAALRVAVEVAPGETAEVSFVLGEAESRDAALALAERLAEPGAVQNELDGIRAFWAGLCGAVRIETPEPALDLLANGWLLYQDLACRMWGRSAFYQSGGAYGYRDQLQDASALVYAAPELTREQIVRHAAHQFAEGDVLHWWHPPTDAGIRTRFSDDLHWLAYITAFYVRTTGDASVLDDVVPFLTAEALPDGEDEVFLQPEPSGESGTVYEHAVRALDRGLAVGAHGLPLMGTGDWNDGMNRVGREGRGESVWMATFLISILGDWAEIAQTRGDDARAETYRAHRAHLVERLNADDAGWDGAWFRRAYYDDGTPLGTATGDECQIDALVQAWSVLSGGATPEHARQALDAMERRLVDADAGIIRLLAPAFDQTPHDPGYIKGYLPGVRENGGQYTHAALWAVRALAEAGRAERAAPLLAMLSPVSHTGTAEGVARYQAEPYSVAADVYGVAPHVGRGGWTWYTGSAGWMLRVTLESVLGLGLEGDAVTLAPCIPASWSGFSLTYRLPDGSGTVLHVAVSRGDAPSATLDGTALATDGARVRAPLPRDGAEHHLTLTL